MNGADLIKKIKSLGRIQKMILLAALFGAAVILATWNGTRTATKKEKSNPVPSILETKRSAVEGAEGKSKKAEKIREGIKRKIDPNANYIPERKIPNKLFKKREKEESSEIDLFGMTKETNVSNEKNETETAPAAPKAKSAPSALNVEIEPKESKTVPFKSYGRTGTVSKKRKRLAKTYVSLLLSGRPQAPSTVEYSFETDTKGASEEKPEQGIDHNATSSGKRAPYVPGRSSLAVLVNGASNFYASSAKVLFDVKSGQLKGWTIIGKATPDSFDGLGFTMERAIDPSGKEYAAKGYAVSVDELYPKFADEVDRHLLERLLLATIGGLADYKMAQASGQGGVAIEGPSNVLSGEIQRELSKYKTEVKVHPGKYVVIIWI